MKFFYGIYSFFGKIDWHNLYTMHEEIATGMYAHIVGIIDLMDCPREQHTHTPCFNEMEFDEPRLIDAKMEQNIEKV